MPATTRRSATLDQSRAERQRPETTRSGRFSKYKDDTGLADLELICNGQSWRVHRLILGDASPKLMQSCLIKSEHGGLPSLELFNQTIPTVSALRDYVYDEDYDYDPELQVSCGDMGDPLALHVKVFLLADSLEMDKLKTLAEEKAAASLADRVDIHDLAQASVTAYESRDIARPLCIRLVAHIATHAELLQEPNTATPLESAMERIPRLGIDIIKATQSVNQMLMCSNVGLNEYRCPNCRFTFQLDMDDDVQYRCPLNPQGACQEGWMGSIWNLENKVEAHETSDMSMAVEEARNGTWWRE